MTLATMTLLMILIMASYTDIESRKVPDSLIIIGLILGLALNGFNFVIGSLIVLVVTFIIMHVYYKFRDLDIMGGGDAKLLMVVGGFIGAKMGLFVLFASMTSALLFIAVMRLLKEKSEVVPLAPFVLLFTILTMNI